ncbi:MAG: redoxin domain-containing protein [Armatimonadetes bacterium]|nr:redoxin domain-containing protein [Armatimonadota bacterium]
MKKFAIALIGLGMISGCALMRSEAGELAPPFQGQAQDKQNYSMLDITMNRPLVVLFTSPEGAVEAKAIKATGILQSALGEKSAQVLIVSQVSVAEFDTWKSKVDLPVPTIADPDRRTSQAYKVKQSPTWVYIGKRGILQGRWEGVSAPMMGEIIARVATDNDITGANSRAEFPGLAAEPELGEKLD